MEIVYYNGLSNSDYPAPNFGDELNLWLWPRILPEITDLQTDALFIGMGTLLNEKLVRKLPTDQPKVVMGTGVGYGDQPYLDSSWKIYCVRGLLSAKSLGLAPEFGITDPAILLKKIIEPSTNKNYNYSYIPHYQEAIINGEAWQNICNDLGIHYIDPTKSIEEVIEDILQTKTLLAEAMHGAIVADALRVPWVPIKTHPRILNFKWQDWLSTLAIDYQPHRIYRKSSKLTKTPILKYFDYQSVKTQLSLIKKSSKSQLSSESVSNDLLTRLEVKLREFQEDYF